MLISIFFIVLITVYKNLYFLSLIFQTSLIHTVLGELSLISGSIQVSGRLSYAAQEPWLFAGSVKQNITFGQPWDAARYREVVKVCALERDMSQLPYGDRSIVGERGVSLSGGQRARVSLARAVYKDADIYLLDDPLSAVDAHVGRHLFDDCIKGYLRHKAVLLVTHQLQYLTQANQILILNKVIIILCPLIGRLFACQICRTSCLSTRRFNRWEWLDNLFCTSEGQKYYIVVSIHKLDIFPRSCVCRCAFTLIYVQFVYGNNDMSRDSDL